MNLYTGVRIPVKSASTKVFLLLFHEIVARIQPQVCIPSRMKYVSVCGIGSAGCLLYVLCLEGVGCRKAEGGLTSTLSFYEHMGHQRILPPEKSERHETFTNMTRLFVASPTSCLFLTVRMASEFHNHKATRSDRAN